MGYGFDLKTSQIYRYNSNYWFFYFNNFDLFTFEKYNIMNFSTKKWVFLKISSLILVPMMLWFMINLSYIYDKDYYTILTFFSSQPSKLLFSFLLIFAYFHAVKYKVRFLRTICT